MQIYSNGFGNQINDKQQKAILIKIFSKKIMVVKPLKEADGLVSCKNILFLTGFHFLRNIITWK